MKDINTKLNTNPNTKLNIRSNTRSNFEKNSEKNSILGALLGFLFGHHPRIFSKDEGIRHNLSQNRWEDWKNNYKQGLEYNWKKHKGMRNN